VASRLRAALPIHDPPGHFVTRAKKDMAFRRRYSRKVDRSTGLVCDRTIVLTGARTRKDYPAVPRRVRCIDPETDKAHRGFAYAAVPVEWLAGTDCLLAGSAPAAPHSAASGDREGSTPPFAASIRMANRPLARYPAHQWAIFPPWRGQIAQSPAGEPVDWAISHVIRW
jgi:hypothetical protein